MGLEQNTLNGSVEACWSSDVTLRAAAPAHYAWRRLLLQMHVFGDADADSIQPAEQSGVAQSGHGACEEFLLFERRERTGGSRVIDDRGGGVNIREVGKDSWGEVVVAAV